MTVFQCKQLKFPEIFKLITYALYDRFSIYWNNYSGCMYRILNISFYFLFFVQYILANPNSPVPNKTRSFGLLNLFRLGKSFIFMGEYISESHESELFVLHIQGSIS